MPTPHPWRAHAGHLAVPTLLLAGAVLLGVGAVWALVLSGTAPLWAGGLAMVGLAYVAFTPMHDASHGAVSGSPKRGWIDQAVGTAMGVVLLAPFSVFRTLHLRHHGATNDPERDPDMWVAGRTAVGTAARCLTIMPHYYAVFFGRLAKGDAGVRRALAPGLVVLAAQLALMGGLAAAGLGAEVLALWVAPGLLASGLLAFLFDWVPHHPHAVRGRHVDTRLILIPGLSLPMLAQNYHLVHHLYPRVPFYRYAALYREIAGEVAERGSPVVRWPRRAAQG